MYRLTLKNFRTFRQKEIEIPARSLVLLNGPSGVGKTTVLEALSFVLYDDNCYSPLLSGGSGPKESTEVILSFGPDNVTISRSKRPNVLRVTLADGVFYLDGPAQEYINYHFSSSNLWLCGSYIAQNSLCNFFTMTANEKMNFLQEICPNQNYERLMGRIETELNTKISEVHQIRVSLEALRINYEQQIQIHGAMVSGISPWTTEQIDSLCIKYAIIPAPTTGTGQRLSYLWEAIGQSVQRERNESEMKWRDLTKRQEERNRVNKRREEVKRGLETLGKENLVPVDLAILGEARSKLIRAIETKKMYSEAKRAKEIEAELLSLGEEKEVDMKILQVEWLFEHDRREVELEYLSAVAIVKGYERARREKTVTELEESIRSLLSKEYSNVKRQLEAQVALSASILPEMKDDLAVAAEIQRAEINSVKYSCPKCHSTLGIQDGCLVEREREKTEISSTLLYDLKWKREILVEIKRLSSQFESVERRCREAQVDFTKEYREDRMGEKRSEEKLTYLLNFERNRLAELQSYTVVASADNAVSAEKQAKLYERFYLGYKQIPESWTRAELLKAKVELEARSTRKYLISELERYKSRAKTDSDSSDPRSQEVLEQELARVEQEYKRGEEMNNKIELIKIQIRMNTQELKDLPELPDNSEEISSLERESAARERESNELIRVLNIQARIFQMMEIYSMYTNKIKEFEDTTKRIVQLNKLKSVVVTSQYVIIDSVLAKLNAVIENILGSLFDVPITVTLAALKQLKTSDRIKPEVNLQIWYKGSEFNKLGSLSGGEQLRISLALCIAFSKLSKSKFLLLDESLSCLDVELKERAISVIKEYSSDKTVIIVNHDTSTSPYDSVINL